MSDRPAIDLETVRQVAAEPPFFVVGCPRSGTTVVRLMLDAHSRLSIPPESNFIIDVGLDPRLGGWSVGEMLGRVLENPNFEFFDLDPGLTARYVTELEPRCFADVARTVFALYAVSRGKRRWGDKTPSHVFYMRRLGRMFPDARFLHVVRDGRDVTASLASMNWGPQALLPSAFWWECALAAARSAAGGLGPERYLEFRLEDLIADPQSSVKEICAFLDELFEEQMLTYYEDAGSRIPRSHADFHPNISRPVTRSLRRWTDGLTDQQVKAVETRLRSELERLGYEPPPALDPLVRAESRIDGWSGIARSPLWMLRALHARSGSRWRAGLAADWTYKKLVDGRRPAPKPDRAAQT
jgi:hypothetical protein